MPEFGDMLNRLDKLELAVQAQKPRRLARAFADWARTEYNVEKRDHLTRTMFDLIVKHHGPLGGAEFIQEVRKRTR